jgi:hypothetical protein
MRTKNSQKFSPRQLLFAVVGLLLVAGGCELEKESLWSPTAGWPIVRGLTVTDENAEVVGIYGTPADGGLTSYPNPAAGVVAIAFRIPERTRVTVWVSRARGPLDPEPSYDAGFGSAQIVVDIPAEVHTLIDEYMDPSEYHVMWNGRDEGDLLQPTGYYRIYARIGAEVLFCDIWFVDGNDIRFPPGLWGVLNRQW